MTGFVEYWENLKVNHPEKYKKRLEANRLRQRKRRHAIYKDPKLHELYKAENRRKYKERRVRFASPAATSNP